MKTQTKLLTKIQIVTAKSILMAAVLSMFAEDKKKFWALFCLAFCARGIIGNVTAKLRNAAIPKNKEHSLIKKRICKFLFKLTGGVTSTIINQFIFKEYINIFLKQVIQESMRQPLYWFILDYFIVDIWLNAGKTVTTLTCMVKGENVNIASLNLPNKPHHLELMIFIKAGLHFAEKCLTTHKYYKVILYFRCLIANEMLKYLCTGKKTDEEFFASFKGKVCVNMIGSVLYSVHTEYFPFSEYLASQIFSWCGELYNPVATVTALICYRHIAHLIYESLSAHFTCDIAKFKPVSNGHNPAPLGQY